MSLLILLSYFLSGLAQVSFTEEEMDLHVFGTEPENQHLQLWSDKPAVDWMREAFPIGNGYMGAMIYGGTTSDTIQLNEESMWTGGPGSNSDYYGGNRKGASMHLAEVRRLMAQNEYNEARDLIKNKLLGQLNEIEKGSTDYGANQPLGNIIVTYAHDTGVSNYKRKLDLQEAIVSVNYNTGKMKYSREYFASYPDKVIAARYVQSKKTSLSISFKSEQEVDSVYIDPENQIITFAGHISQNGQKYICRIHIRNNDGNISLSKDKIELTNNSGFELYIHAFTNYSPEHPDYVNKLFPHKKFNVIERLKEQRYSSIRSRHIADYQKLFQRVQFDLGHSNNQVLPTAQRLQKYADGDHDPGLEVLYFQYGRYLLISSSRPGSLPAHLQGKWNNSVNPPWACDYHTNINVQMNYWPAEVTNLSECAEPLNNFIGSLVKPGSITAKEMFGARGWTTSTMTNIWGFTSNGWGLPWGYFPGAGAWLAQHLWEHYDFSRDKAYLDTFAYPIMKGAALFWLDYLTEDEQGYLVSNPSFSPEHGGISSGATMDHQIAWDIFNNTIEACKVLQRDTLFMNELLAARERILPLQIGRWGQLQEWKEDIDNPNNKHRHVSHLFGLHPGNQISMQNTPKLAKAAKVSLNARGNEGTGWSLAWKINFRARLYDGEKAYQMLKALLKPVRDGDINYMDGGGTYSNLLCAHPPFQVDGNLGGTAGIAEMILQSNDGTINLLPALPKAWTKGSICGLKARGGFIVDMEWKNGKLVKATITSTVKNTVVVRYQGFIKEIDLAENESVTLSNF